MDFARRALSFLEPGMLQYALALVVAVVAVFWDVIGLPSTGELTELARAFFDNYGLYALYVAAVIESLFVLSLYFPGSFVVILAILVSDRSLLALGSIVLIGWLSVLSATVVNYWLGKEGFYRALLFLGSQRAIGNMQESLQKHGKLTVFFSGIHPNILAIANICLGIARVGLSRALFLTAMSIAFWLPLQVYVLGFLLPDPQANSEYLQWVLVAALVLWGSFNIFRAYPRQFGDTTD